LSEVVKFIFEKLSFSAFIVFCRGSYNYCNNRLTCICFII